MGDLVLRVSLLVQRGWACSECGSEIDGQMTGGPRQCRACLRRTGEQTDHGLTSSGYDSAGSAAPVCGAPAGGLDD